MWSLSIENLRNRDRDRIPAGFSFFVKNDAELLPETGMNKLPDFLQIPVVRLRITLVVAAVNLQKLFRFDCSFKEFPSQCKRHECIFAAVDEQLRDRNFFHPLQGVIVVSGQQLHREKRVMAGRDIGNGGESRFEYQGFCRPILCQPGSDAAAQRTAKNNDVLRQHAALFGDIGPGRRRIQIGAVFG